MVASNASGAFCDREISRVGVGHCWPTPLLEPDMRVGPASGSSMDEASRSRSRHPVVACGSPSAGDGEVMLAGKVQQFQVGERASTTRLEWDDSANDPPIVFDNG